MTGKIGRAKNRAIRCASTAVWLFAAPCGAFADGMTAAAEQSVATYFIWNVIIGGLVVGAFTTAIVFWVATALSNVQRQQRQRNEFVGSALNHLGQGIVMLDAQKRLVFCNDRYLDIYKLTRAEMTRDMTGPALRALRRERGTADVNEDVHYDKAMSSGGYVAELPGEQFIHVKFSRLPNGGWIGIHEDCTQQRRMQNELASTKKFQQTVLDNIPVSLMVQEVATGRYLFANRNAEVILGRRREDAIGKTVLELLRPQEAKIIVARDEAAIKSRMPMAEEHPISTRDGLRLFLTRRVTVQGEDGTQQYLIKTHEDVTDRRQTEARMAHMAYHDGLTGLPNRPSFLQSLTQMIDACTEAEEEFAVLSIDLDGLKEINDVFGHAIGDKLLADVSKRIEAAVGGGVVARLGGDEFGVIIDGQQPQTGQALAERIAVSLAEPFPIDGKVVRIGVTTGISLFPRDGHDAAALLANSGAALFRAKSRSRGSISVFEPEMDRQLRDRRVLHQDLSTAIRNGELSLHYQPQARASENVQDADITGFEALARWIHPTRGFVSPADFIPLAEESGLIVEMGEKQERFGRKNGKGFYEYPPKGKGSKALWKGIAPLLPKPVDPDTLDVEELKQRFLVVQAVEAARTVEDNVILDPREADVGSILGFGFAPFTGGTLSYIDFMGTKKFVELCHKLEKKYGSRFAPPKLLEEMAAKGETFYGRFAPKKVAA